MSLEKAERVFLDGLVRDWYPEVYARLHGTSAESVTAAMVEVGIAERESTTKDLKAEAKRLHIPCRNWMPREDLIRAIELRIVGNEAALEGIVSAARERYKIAWDNYRSKTEKENI